MSNHLRILLLLTGVVAFALSILWIKLAKHRLPAQHIRRWESITGHGELRSTTRWTPA